MILPDLSPATQVGLRVCVAILVTMALIRVAVLFRRQHAQSPHRYPSSWTTEQVTVFERARVIIGVGLATTWAVLELASPRMPQSWPFGLAQMSLTVGLLLLTNAWLLLIVPSDWENTVVGKLNF